MIITHYLILEKYQSQQLFDESILIISLISNCIGSKIGAITGFKAFSEEILMKLFIAVLSITWLNYVIDVSSNFI